MFGVKQSLTTADKRPSERLEFWQEIVCKKYVVASAETEVLDNEFSGALTSGELGSLIVAELDAPLHFWSRKPRHVRNDGPEVFIVSLIQEGAGELTQFGRSARQNVAFKVTDGSYQVHDRVRQAFCDPRTLPREIDVQ